MCWSYPSAYFYSVTPSLEDLLPKRVKRKVETEASTRDPFWQELKDMDERFLSYMGESRFDENDEATSFCLSLIRVLQDFDKRKLRLAKLKIQQLLYDIEFDNE